MLALAFGLIIVGYALQYTGVNNLNNGGRGPTLFQALGFSSSLTSPGGSGLGGLLGSAAGQAGQTGAGAAQGSSNQTGQPPTVNASPAVIVPGGQTTV